jgi:hypothetical protein
VSAEPHDAASPDEPGEPPVFATLEELQQFPELLRAPESVIPRFAYRGRLTALAGPDKSGKSTLAAHAMTSLSWGKDFLGEPVSKRYGRTVLLGFEEAVGDEVRRLTDLAACAARINVLQWGPPEVLLRTRELLKAWPADLLVVDSLTECARVMLGEVPANGDDSGWSAVIRPLVALSRQFDLAVLVLHHTRRSDGQYRGASEIAAAVDAMIEMENPKPGEDPTLRRFTGRGRWSIEPFTIVQRDHGYELGGGTELSLDARLLLHVEKIPGLSTGELRRRVGSRKEAVIDALRRLSDRGAIENRGAEVAGHAWHPFRPQTELEVDR